MSGDQLTTVNQAGSDALLKYGGGRLPSRPKSLRNVVKDSDDALSSHGVYSALALPSHALCDARTETEPLRCAISWDLSAPEIYPACTLTCTLRTLCEGAGSTLGPDHDIYRRCARCNTAQVKFADTQYAFLHSRRTFKGAFLNCACMLGKIGTCVGLDFVAV